MAEPRSLFPWISKNISIVDIQIYFEIFLDHNNNEQQKTKKK